MYAVIFEAFISIERKELFKDYFIRIAKVQKDYTKESSNANY